MDLSPPARGRYAHMQIHLEDSVIGYRVVALMAAIERGR